MDLKIRDLQEKDCQLISDAFATQGWSKPVTQYQNYLEIQASGERDVLVATIKGEFAGYLTICWQSDYLPFREQGIPEIVDFNVLQKFQRNGIGTALMDEAENRIAQVAPMAGIGFGLLSDYGAAQVLYIRRGYIPDGRGVVVGSCSLTYGDVVTMGDDQVLCLTKQLNRKS